MGVQYMLSPHALTPSARGTVLALSLSSQLVGESLDFFSHVFSNMFPERSRQGFGSEGDFALTGLLGGTLPEPKETAWFYPQRTTGTSAVMCSINYINSLGGDLK